MILVAVKSKSILSHGVVRCIGHRNVCSFLPLHRVHVKKKMSGKRTAAWLEGTGIRNVSLTTTERQVVQ